MAKISQKLTKQVLTTIAAVEACRVIQEFIYQHQSENPTENNTESGKLSFRLAVLVDYQERQTIQVDSMFNETKMSGENESSSL